MVDYFSLAVSHAVLLIAFWRLLSRDDLDADPAGENEQAGRPPVRHSRRA